MSKKIKKILRALICFLILTGAEEVRRTVSFSQWLFVLCNSSHQLVYLRL